MSRLPQGSKKKGGGMMGSLKGGAKGSGASCSAARACQTKPHPQHTSSGSEHTGAQDHEMKTMK